MKKRMPKRIMIAAPKSGSGKTTVTTALLYALAKRGFSPGSYKCGPDYIDPLFHETVLGVESRNLDAFFSGGEGMRNILSDCTGDCAVLEGVMGLYDGMRVSDIKGSSYETASLTDTPIILVVDAASTGRTVIPMIKGILADDGHKLIKGVILNRISSGFYEEIKPVLSDALSEMGDVRLLGSIPRNESISIGSRHLGLMLPNEISDIRKKIGLAAEMLEECVDMDALIAIMDEYSGPAHESAGIKAVRGALCTAGSAVPPDGSGLTLAVAYDGAFCFYYRANLEAFSKRGVQIRYFSPMNDPAVPPDADGILLGGGYPENHLIKLSGNTSMLRSVKEAIDSGIPTLAECGGYMYLHKTIKDPEGNSFPMAGVVDGECFYSGHLVRFGYMQIESAAGSGTEGLTQSLIGMKGHEFHYYDSTACGRAFTARKPGRDISWECCIEGGNGIWGFPHFYYDSCPGFAESFIRRMKEKKHG
ncbi:MAG: cobyrinate a,c-diamide synthase [Lachnospiraceae bacterium]|nr:cobyrinate a,c-diamide synthase [Lachnospiraceae bacterium]